ncbi:MAG: glycosyltransferase [Prevotella sp.]|nr:glycosyltransferase [Prevotella sp.]
MELSIIVPVYNVEKYVRPCIESILRQGLDEARYEVIIVNDGSTDNTIHVLEDLLAKHHNITVVHQDKLGVAIARNTGLIHAVGDYVMFIDADDLLVENALGPLLKEVLKEQPDLLAANFVKMTDEEIEHQRGCPSCEQEDKSQRECPHAFQSVTGKEFFLHHLNPRACYVWRTLYRNEFIRKHHLQFISGIYFEDVPFTITCSLKAERCIVASHTLYIYRQHTGSIVSSINKKKMMDMHVVLATLWDMRPQVTDEEKRRKLMEAIFTTFSIEMWYITHHQHLFAERKAIIHDLKKTVPDLHFDNSLKERVISFLYKHLPFVYLRLRALGK